MITCLCLTNDGNLLVSGSVDGKIVIWDIKRGLNIRTLSDDKNKVSSLAISSNDKLIVAGYMDGTIKVWCLVSGNCNNILKRHTEYVNSVMFDKNNDDLLFSCSDDMTIKKWSLSNESCNDFLNNVDGDSLSFNIDKNSEYIFINIGYGKKILKTIEIILKTMSDPELKVIYFYENFFYLYEKKLYGYYGRLLPDSAKFFSYSFGFAKNREIFGYRKSRIIFTGYIYSEGKIIPKAKPVISKKTWLF